MSMGLSPLVLLVIATCYDMSIPRSINRVMQIVSSFELLEFELKPSMRSMANF